MSNSPVSIRTVRDTDLADITEIYADAVATTNASWEWTPPPLSEMSRRCRALLDEGYPYLVADAEGVIAGYAYAGRFRGRAAYQWTVENSVYVRPEMSGLGIGRQLLQALINECTKRNFRQMVAVIGSSENAASIKLHAGLGFREAGRLDGIGWKNGKWHDWVLMALPLGQGSDSPPVTGKS